MSPRSHPRVFVSSVEGFAAHRQAARVAIAQLGGEASWLTRTLGRRTRPPGMQSPARAVVRRGHIGAERPYHGIYGQGGRIDRMNLAPPVREIERAVHA